MKTKPNYRAGLGWRDEEEQLLGNMSDAEIARRIERSETAVRQKRRRKRVITHQSTFHRWTKDEDSLMGKYRDEEVAARTG